MVNETNVGGLSIVIIFSISEITAHNLIARSVEFFVAQSKVFYSSLWLILKNTVDDSIYRLSDWYEKKISFR